MSLSSPTDVCGFCHKTVSPRELAVEAMKRQYHAQCFTCRTCRRQLAGQSFYQKDGRPLCEACYQVTTATATPPRLASGRQALGWALGSCPIISFPTGILGGRRS